MCCHRGLGPESQLTLILRSSLRSQRTRHRARPRHHGGHCPQADGEDPPAPEGRGFCTSPPGGSPRRPRDDTRRSLPPLQRGPPLDRRGADPPRAVPRRNASHPAPGGRAGAVHVRHPGAPRPDVPPRRATRLAHRRRGRGRPPRPPGPLALGLGAHRPGVRVPRPGQPHGDGPREPLPHRGGNRRTPLRGQGVRRDRLGVDLQPLRPAARGRSLSARRAQPRRGPVLPRRGRGRPPAGGGHPPLRTALGKPRGGGGARDLYARTGAEEESRRSLEEALASARTRHERRLIALQVRRARDSYAGGSKTG